MSLSVTAWSPFHQLERGTGSWTGHHNGTLSFFLTGSRDTDAEKDGAQPWRVRTDDR